MGLLPFPRVKLKDFIFMAKSLFLPLSCILSLTPTYTPSSSSLHFSFPISLSLSLHLSSCLSLSLSLPSVFFKSIELLKLKKKEKKVMSHFNILRYIKFKMQTQVSFNHHNYYFKYFLLWLYHLRSVAVQVDPFWC